MKRINLVTNKPFSRGEIREDGFLFWNYKSTTDKNGFFYEQWLRPEVFYSEKKNLNERGKKRYAQDDSYKTRQLKSFRFRFDKAMTTKEGHIKNIFLSRKARAKKDGIPFEISLEHVIEIAPDQCPVFGKPLLWAQRNGYARSMSPTLDKIDPSLGYVPGNVQWLSHLANIMKCNATPTELIKFSEWCIKNFKDK